MVDLPTQSKTEILTADGTGHSEFEQLKIATVLVTDERHDFALLNMSSV
jgi:hypothetical protein